jgi:hypothetical protein
MTAPPTAAPVPQLLPLLELFRELQPDEVRTPAERAARRLDAGLRDRPEQPVLVELQAVA